MNAPAPLAAHDIAAFLQNQSHKPTLRFITCGSVDDGKSTLIGRLLYESKAIFDDQLAAIESDSRTWGTQGEKIDLALLVDGLQAEREQGITIDVAYRFFATDKRRYIVADTPGHEQYTRNMATGASTADVAVILIDARKGVLVQTRRHSRIVAMMGIRHVVLAVNKMDLVGCDQAVFDEIVAEYRAFAAPFGFETLQPIPLSGLEGDNVLAPSTRMPWYAGPTLMQHLDTVDVWGSGIASSNLRGVPSGLLVSHTTWPRNPVMRAIVSAKARRGELKNFTGIDSPYEAPEAPEVRLQTRGASADDCVEQVYKRSM